MTKQLPHQIKVIVAVDKAMQQRPKVLDIVNAANSFVGDSEASNVPHLARDLQQFLRENHDDEISVAHKHELDLVTLLLVYGRPEPKSETVDQGEPKWLN